MIKGPITVFLTLLFFTGTGQELKRRADIGAAISFPDGVHAGASVKSVDSDHILAKNGLQAGDKIIRLNGELIKDPDRWSDIEYDLRAGEEVELVVSRDGNLQTIHATLPALAKESYKDIEVVYGEVLSNYGDLIRTITTYPENLSQQLPGLIILGGLSCSSIEVYPGRNETGWTRVLRDIATKSGMVVMRVEKPGVGDSNGHCGESTFYQDIAAFKAAYQSLKNHDKVDSTNIIIYGSSMGSALAPYMANEMGAEGVISDGTFVKTWFEHMLEIERRIKLMQGKTPMEVSQLMNEAYIPLYYGMLIEKKSYAEVIREKPHLKAHNYHSEAHMYGRPVAYYHEVQDFNFAKAWEEIEVPVRIIRGTNDWIMSDDDNDMIIDILEANGHKDHELYRYEGLDHWNAIHENPEDSFNGKPGKWEDKISGVIIDFARELAKLD
ncbi:serine aminopeptidase domain-containing protein [Fulvivirga aurantia]|uniref:serine aminopeptidase domain-containing protein n=1 Tax=Fulvivirga aurantia TaxID=2529383 RepID=UPI0016279662|nr:alpha/beta hydrolase [Fulvivirga aurantia]